MSTDSKQKVRRGRTTLDEITRMRKLRDEGYSTKQIQEMTGRSEQTVLVYARVRDTRRKVTKYQIDRMQSMRRKGYSTAEIVERLGVGRQTVLRYAGRSPGHDQAGTLAKLHALRRSGVTNVKEQAEILGVHWNTIYKWMREFGIDTPGNTTWNPTTKEIKTIRDYYDRRGRKVAVLKELAQEYGVSYGTMQNVIYRKGRYQYL